MLARLASGAPPSAFDADLRSHVAGCVSCRQTLMLVQALRSDQAIAVADASLPTASQVWWRARVRSRLEAAHEADRPIGVVQALSIAALTGLAASLVGADAAGGALRQAWHVVADVAGPDVATAVSSVVGGGPLWITVVVGACLAALMPVAAAIALSRD